MSARKIAQLKRALKRAGIIQDRVAAEAGVTRTFVCHVLAGRFTSRRVLAAAQRLLAAASNPPPEGGAANGDGLHASPRHQAELSRHAMQEQGRRAEWTFGR